MGELAIDAAWAGMYGVPVLFCASDDKCVAEARATFGPIAAVETKQSLSWTSAISRHPAAVCRDIYDTVLKAARQGVGVPPFTFAEPLQVELRYQRMDQAAQAALRDVKGKGFAFVDAHTRTGTVASLRDLF